MQDEKQQNQEEVVPAIQTVTFEHSQGIGKLVDALSKAGAEFKPAFKDAINPTYRAGSKYVPLENLIDATREALSKHGLAVMQLPSVDETNVLVTTLLAHSSGEWISSTLSLPGDQRGRFDAQSVGSGITYARRYAYQSILNIAGEVDDDGNAAAGVGSKEAAQDAGKKQLAEYSTKVKDAVKGKVLEYTLADVGGVKSLVLVQSPIVAGMMEFGLKEITSYSDSLKTRVMAASNIQALISVAEPLGITVKEKGAASKPEKAHSDAKVIKSAVIAEGKGKKWLKVNFGNDDVVTAMTCWVPDLWDEIVANIGNPADFVMDAKGKNYIQGIVSMNGRSYSTMEDGTRTPDRLITDDDLPEMMRP